MGKAIMIQGTASGVGKSTLMTGLCRAFRQAGYSVAPFKAQNMSSNAHVFPDGRQMARSQAIGAWACGSEPEPDMNPVLLKPLKPTGSEVILQGHSIGNLMNYEYNALKLRLAQEVHQAYRRLLSRYDIVVVEGAGSPVELNLRQNDIVNMGFAKRENCPVLLVADISRGGVFASAYGTVRLMEPEEQTLVKGIIVNKFCGRREYFGDGVKILEEITEKPVLGVMPAVQLRIEDEDSVGNNGVVQTREDIERTLNGKSYRAHLEQQFDLLARTVRENVDLDAIYRIMEG